MFCERQTLCWNPLFKTDSRCLIVMTPCVAWGPFAIGVVTTLKQWNIVCSLPKVERKIVLAQYMGGYTIFQEIERVVDSTNFQPMEDKVRRWVGTFSQSNVFRKVKALLSSKNPSCFMRCLIRKLHFRTMMMLLQSKVLYSLLELLDI